MKWENYPHFGNIGKNCTSTKLIFSILKIQCSLSLRGLNFLSAVESWFLNQYVNANMNIQHEIGKIHPFLSWEMGLFFGPNLRDATALVEDLRKAKSMNETQDN